MLSRAADRTGATRSSSMGGGGGMGRGPTGVIAEAAWLAASLTVLVIGCAVDETWWSLLTATCYLLALGIWMLFQPGCMPCVPATSAMDMSAGVGCCGARTAPRRSQPPRLLMFCAARAYLTRAPARAASYGRRDVVERLGRMADVVLRGVDVRRGVCAVPHRSCPSRLSLALKLPPTAAYNMYVQLRPDCALRCAFLPLLPSADSRTVVCYEHDLWGDGDGVGGIRGQNPCNQLERRWWLWSLALVRQVKCPQECETFVHEPQTCDSFSAVDGLFRGAQCQSRSLWCLRGVDRSSLPLGALFAQGRRLLWLTSRPGYTGMDIHAANRNRKFDGAISPKWHMAPIHLPIHPSVSHSSSALRVRGLPSAPWWFSFTPRSSLSLSLSSAVVAA